MAKVEKFKVYEGVFDEFTIKVLDGLKRKKYFTKLIKPIKCGKEADVYLAQYEENKFRAIKIYRINNSNFKKITQYISMDYRFKNLKGNTRKIINEWVKKEFRNLKIMYKNNILTPIPITFKNNVLIMDFIEGHMLKDEKLENPKETLSQILFQIKLLIKKAKLFHGDLSPFNILFCSKNKLPILIDVGQSVLVKDEVDFKKYEYILKRDFTNIINHFNKKYILRINIDEKYKEFIEELDNKNI